MVRDDSEQKYVPRGATDSTRLRYKNSCNSRSRFLSVAARKTCWMRGMNCSACAPNPAVLGAQALQFMPRIQQVFLAATDRNLDLELQLFLYRKRVESVAPRGTYFCSLSSRTMVYKGLLSPSQLASFYPDLMHP